ncbi:MAG: hypothetical protein LBQ57_00610 [Spirochaetales bacterium]|nr:hypothetical protein [Spirochaetales bacterium]
MLKRLSTYFLAGGLCLVIFLLSACPSEVKIIPTALTNAVYTGELPGGDWLSICFTSAPAAATGKGNVFWAANAAVTQCDYTYNSVEGTGEISGGGVNPGVFRISDDDGRSITFSNYAGSGTAREFRQIRQTNGTLNVVPFAPASGPLTGESTMGSLYNTVWAGETTETNSWLTIVFDTGGGLTYFFGHKANSPETINNTDITFAAATSNCTVTSAAAIPFANANRFTIAFGQGGVMTIAVPGSSGSSPINKTFRRLR